MQTEYSVVGHWTGGFEERSLQRWAEELRARLPARSVSLGLVFLAPRFFPQAAQILELLQVHAQVPLLAGCSSSSLIAGGEELERNAGIVLALYALPNASFTALHFNQQQVEEGNGPGFWHFETEVDPGRCRGWLVFADPFNLDSERWLHQWNEAYAGLPILGGLASGDQEQQLTQVYLDRQVYEEGAIGIAFTGKVKLFGVISQGCTPIGETWTITKAEQNLIHEIGNRPAYQVLVETYNRLSTEDQQKARGNLFIGLVMNEYLEEFQRGDFLIRNLMGADPRTGALAVGALPRAGQTIQFQRRDAQAATEDMSIMLGRARQTLARTPIYGGCLCSCNGRGQRLFGRPHHDAGWVQDQFGPLGVAGFFCNGEIGPVGDRTFLHGYTASLALFVEA